VVPAHTKGLPHADAQPKRRKESGHRRSTGQCGEDEADQNRVHRELGNQRAAPEAKQGQHDEANRDLTPTRTQRLGGRGRRSGLGGNIRHGRLILRRFVWRKHDQRQFCRWRAIRHGGHALRVVKGHRQSAAKAPPVAGALPVNSALVIAENDRKNKAPGTLRRRGLWQTNWWTVQGSNL
jgi:hypothetical protein